MTPPEDITVEQWLRHLALVAGEIECLLREQPPATDELGVRRYARDRSAELRRLADHLGTCQAWIATLVEKGGR